MNRLSEEELSILRSYDTPTVSNAIEQFDLRPRTEGFMRPDVHSIFGGDTPVVGYACTAKISAAQPATEKQQELLYEYYQSVIDCESTPIAVIQDIDEPPVGSFWGEVQVSVHKSMGCNAVITNGGVRDLDEARGLGFSYFASCVLVSHGYVHVEQVGVPVTFAGLTVQPGDLLHADKHGVLLIPAGIAPRVAEACERARRAEVPVVEGCRSMQPGEVTVERLREWRNRMISLRKGEA